MDTEERELLLSESEHDAALVQRVRQLATIAGMDGPSPAVLGQIRVEARAAVRSRRRQVFPRLPVAIAASLLAGFLLVLPTLHRPANASPVLQWEYGDEEITMLSEGVQALRESEPLVDDGGTPVSWFDRSAHVAEEIFTLWTQIDA